MKNIFLLIISGLITQSLNAQSSAICIYKISPIEQNHLINDKTYEMNIKARELLKKIFLLAKDLDFVLKFNDTESISHVNEGIINEGIQNTRLYPMALALIGKGIYYQDKKSNIQLHQLESMGSLFIIEDKLTALWKITNEKRKIGHYKCLKATLDCSSCNQLEEIWFTPDIPAPFGPKGYGGLPGLIVEIKGKGFILKLHSISFTNKEIEIKKPSKGKRISIEDYHAMTQKVRSNGRKMNQ